VQILAAMVLGCLVGYLWPQSADSLRPLGDLFIRLVRMIVAPIMFCTVVHGIASVGEAKRVGRVAIKTLIYFEVVTTIALVLGLVMVNAWRPGAGMNIDPATLEDRAVVDVEQQTKPVSYGEFLVSLVPTSAVGAFAEGDVLPVLFFSVMFGFALLALGPTGQPIVAGVHALSQVLFKMIAFAMYVAPIGAFGAMAFTVGRFGPSSLVALGNLVLMFYVLCALFVLVVLGAVSAFSGFSLWKFLRYIRAELLLVLGTSSSESALPRLIERLEELGCDRGVVGLVVPTGYSFNLDGTCIYLTMAAIFIAQAYGVALTPGDQLLLLGVLLLTSKGAAGVTGAGFITLTATLAALNGKVPVEGVALILGIDRFMSEARAITNIIGNGVATLFVARWEGMRDDAKMRAALDAGPGTA
jgi:aerobic C4-dicarboxylate transport protein